MLVVGEPADVRYLAGDQEGRVPSHARYRHERSTYLSGSAFCLTFSSSSRIFLLRNSIVSR